MHIALAGRGGVSRYICEEFVKAGHRITLLSRKAKPQVHQHGIFWCSTDYSLDSLAPSLTGPEVLISTISDFTSANVNVHAALIEACGRSPTCKQFISLEYATDIDRSPDQPESFVRSREPVYELLRQQNDLEWTLVRSGWLADFLIPSQNRYIEDPGDLFPLDLQAGRLVIPGSGDEPVDFTWARDLAKALAQLVQVADWEPYTLISGTQTTWNELRPILSRKYGPGLVETYALEKQICDALKGGGDELKLAGSRHSFVSEIFHLPRAQVEKHRNRFFSNFHFRTVQEGLDEFDIGSEHIV